MSTNLDTVASPQPFAPRSRGGVALRLTAVDEVGIEARAKALATRSIKTRSKRAVLHLTIASIDLTTLEGMDAPRKVAALCRKAVRPDLGGSAVPSVAAVCVCPQMVLDAVLHTAGPPVKAARVAGAFPSGQ